MDKLWIEKIKNIFNGYPEIKVAYLFGSRARGDDNSRSDYDFAVYLEENDSSKRFNLRLKLMSDLSKVVETDDVDVIVLNKDDTDHPTLKYSIISEGIVMKDIEPYRLIIENSILNEYFDFNLDFKKRAKVLN